LLNCGAAGFSRIPQRYGIAKIDRVWQLETLNLIGSPCQEIWFSEYRAGLQDHHRVDRFAQPVVRNPGAKRDRDIRMSGQKMVDLKR